MYFPDTSYGDVSADCIITSDLAMRAAMDVGFIGSSRRWEVVYFTSVFIIYHQQVVGENVYREVTFSFDGVDRFISYYKEYVSGDDYILKVRVGSGFELAGEYDWGKYSSKPECHIKLWLDLTTLPLISFRSETNDYIDLGMLSLSMFELKTSTKPKDYGEGKLDGYIIGYDDGYSEGFMDGEFSGNEVGWSDGYAAGTGVGYTEGYGVGYTAVREIIRN